MDSIIRRCRLCFTEEVNQDSLFQMVDNNGIFLSTKIILCTSLMIRQGDLFSENVCNSCVEMIELFYEFRNTCLKTHISMYNAVYGLANVKLNLTEQENLKKVTEKDIFIVSENVETMNENTDEHLVEIETGNNVGESLSNYVTSSSAKADINVQIDINKESSRQFQVGCYIPIGDIETGHEGNNIKETSFLRRRFKCMNCKYVFPTLSELDNHWDMCESVKEDCEMDKLGCDDLQYSDEGCFENSEITKTLEHFLTEEENKEKKRSSGREFCCESCGQVFKQLLLLKRHIQVKHVCVRPYSCPHCPRKFFDKYELKYHQRLHEDIEDFCCSICKRRFSRRSGLKTHMRTHTGEKPFECKICNKSFAYLNTLIAHERVHTGERPYLCRFCPRTFAQYSTAKSHEDMHMGGLRMFQCEICDRMFKTESEMTVHHVTHQVSNDCKCTLCNRGFKKQSDLNKHNERYHCDNKPYPCGHCSKSYVTLRELQIHTTVHTGELPYICLICSKSYRLSTTLKRHMFKHHHLNTDVSNTYETAIIKS